MTSILNGAALPSNFVPFELHPNTLRMIIQEQSGTWEKAIAELIMNSVDAGASQININYTCSEDLTQLLDLTVSDDGHGFHNDDQLNFFKVFGAPHAEGDAYYGKYRIGRGQCLSFGRVKWRSHNYEMFVDLGDPNEKETPLEQIGYHLNRFDEIHEGCSVKVEFFNPIRIWKGGKLTAENRTKQVFEDLIELVKFIPIPVYINGLCISYDYSKIKWTCEDEQAYYLIQSMSDTSFKDLKDNLSTLSIYNRGVLATSFSGTWKGCCGVVITKNQIKMNMARNSIMDGDEYWYCIQHKIDQLASEAFVTTIKEPKTDEERAVVINQIYLDDTFVAVNSIKQIEHFLTLPLFKMQNGKLVSVVQLLKNSKIFTVCPDPVGRERTTISERLEKKKIIVVDHTFMGSDHVFGKSFAEDFVHNSKIIFSEFLRNIIGLTASNDPHHVLFEIEAKYGSEYIKTHGISIQKIKNAGVLAKRKLRELMDYAAFEVNFYDYENLAQGLDVTYKNLSENDLNEEELACFKAIRRVNAKFKEYNFGDRKLKIGESDHALAWTDSYSTIWITKNVLNMMRANQFNQIVLILLHEYCHREGNKDTHASHKHNLEFYESFHNLSIKLPIDQFGDLLQNQYVRWLAESQTRPSSKIAYSLDRVFEHYPDLVRKNTVEMRHKFGRMAKKFEAISQKDL